MCAENAELKKALLVCSSGCTGVKEHLLHAGYRVTRVGDGTAALERARHELLSAAVLVSTGTQMDLAETVFNLKDIDPGVEIIIIADADSPEEKMVQTAAITRAFPGTPVLTINELDGYLATHERRN
jgi:CheY-like chemotaxis protein